MREIVALHHYWLSSSADIRDKAVSIRYYVTEIKYSAWYMWSFVN
jgi:hypothetical protein